MAFFVLNVFLGFSTYFVWGNFFGGFLQFFCLVIQTLFRRYELFFLILGRGPFQKVFGCLGFSSGPLSTVIHSNTVVFFISVFRLFAALQQYVAAVSSIFFVVICSLCVCSMLACFSLSP